MQESNLTTLIEKVKSNHYWFLIIGILLVIGGLLTFSNLIVATIVTIYLLAGFLIAIGLSQLIQTFYLKKTSLFFLTLIWSIVYIIVGGYIFIFPVAATELLTLSLGFLLVFFGISRLVSWFMIRQLEGSAWLFLTSAMNILLGLLVVSGWPSNSLILFGLFFGIDLLMQGFCFIMMSTAFKNQ